MKTLTITQLIISGLAAWRYAHLLTHDTILEPTRLKLLYKYEKFSHKTTAKNHKHFHQWLWQKLEVLFVCIYCITFWTALLNYTTFNFINNIGAIWGLATLIGLTHNYFFMEDETEPNDEQDTVE